MIVRRHLVLLFALAALVFEAGCNKGDGGTLVAETDDPSYQHAMGLKRFGRHVEALPAFLKAIEIRGERAAPESHFEAGEIYLNQIKDPIYAIYHYRKYVEFAPPNSKQVPLVRERINTAMRELAGTFPGRLLEDQSMRLEATAEIESLRRELQEARAEIATLRGNSAAAANRTLTSIVMPGASPAPRSNAIPISPVSPASESRAVTNEFVPAPSKPVANTAPRPPPAPQQKATTTRGPGAVSGKTHTVQPKETLYAVSRKFGVTVEELARANGIRDLNNVPVGTVLRIPQKTAP